MDTTTTIKLNEKHWVCGEFVVLEHVNHASGDLEVLRAGYGSQNSFRLQGMQPH